LHRIAVVHDLGSAGVLDIIAALEGFAIPVFVCPESQHIQQPKQLMAEFGILCDITGMNLQEAAKCIGEQAPEGIVTFSEYQLERTAQLAERLGFPFHSPHRIEYLTRKHVQREILNASGVSSVPTRLVRDEGTALRALEEVGAPAVFKPDRGSGSRSVYLIENTEDLIRACSEIFPPGAASDDVEPFVLEQQIPNASPEFPWGDYVSVESAIHNGEISHIAVTGKFPLAEPFRETGSFLPADLPDSMHDMVLKITSRAIQALMIQHGLCHTEIKLSPQGPQVIEVNGRLGGRIHELLYRAKGINSIEIAARIALGDETALHTAIQSTYQSISFLYAKVPHRQATKLLNVRGVEKLQGRHEISRVVVHQNVGDHLDWRSGRLGNIYVCYGSTQTHKELADLIVDIEQTVQVTYE
jgi:biotin carboxylase